jgi:hypothetical protein
MTAMGQYGWFPSPQSRHSRGKLQTSFRLIEKGKRLVLTASFEHKLLKMPVDR